MKSSSKKHSKNVPNSININFNDNIERVHFNNNVENNRRESRSINVTQEETSGDIWKNSRVSELIQKRDNERLKKIKVLKLIPLIIFPLIIITISIFLIFEKNINIQDIQKVSTIVYINNQCNIIFDNNTTYKIDNPIKYDSSTGEPYVFSNMNGSTWAIIDINNSLHIISKDNHQIFDDVDYVLLSPNGDGIIYIKNANSVNSVKNKELKSGDLCYFNTSTKDNIKIDSNVLNAYLAISSTGKSFSYITDYDEIIDNDNSEKNKLSFSCYICTDYGKSKEESFKGFSESAINPIIISLSDNANIIYWYDVQSIEVDKYPLYVSFKKSKNKKSDNTIGTIYKDATKQNTIFSYDCTQMLLSNSESSYIIDNNGNQTKISNNMVDSILNVDTINNVAITDTLFNKYFSTTTNDVLFVNSTGESTILSSGNCTDVIISKDNTFFVAKKVNTNSLLKVNIEDGFQESISNDVVSYIILDDTIYYLDSSQYLFAYKDETSIDIASNVKENFFICNDLIYYISENHLYFYDGTTSTQIDNGNNVIDIYSYSNTVVFKTDNKEYYMIDENSNITKII